MQTYIWMEYLVKANESGHLISNELGVGEATNKEHTFDVVLSGGVTNLHSDVIENVSQQTPRQVFFLPVSCQRTTQDCLIELVLRPCVVHY